MTVVTATLAVLLVLTGVGTLVRAFRAPMPGEAVDDVIVLVGSAGVFVGMFILTVLAVAE